MGKLQKNEKGFSAVEVVLVIVIVALIGVVGWMVYKNHHKTTSVTTVTTSRSSSATTPSKLTTNPYAEWKSYTLQYEKISFNYPSNWTLKDNSQTMAEANQELSPVSCTLNNGTDDVTLTAPGGNSVSLETGVECASGIGDATYSSFLPIRVLGNNYYLGFESASNGVITSVAITTQNTNNSTTGDNYLIRPESKNIAGSNSPLNLFNFNPVIATSEPPQGQTLAETESSTDFSTAKLIFESMKYNN
ncbi:MAG TPA: PsbP-related protein [Candidatus Saccharimonadales bacterium]|nr:PsbP-related protein [Candidatus Saccharimonadales bacterium]